MKENHGTETKLIFVKVMKIVTNFYKFVKFTIFVIPKVTIFVKHWLIPVFGSVIFFLLT